MGLSDLNNRLLFLIALEAGKSRIRVPADSVSGEGLFLFFGGEELFLGLQTNHLLDISSRGRGGVRKVICVSLFLIRALTSP